MFKDFLDEIGIDDTSESMALESLAGFYDIIDFDIATEGIKELGAKIKEKMAGLGKRIEDFVVKVRNWITTKLLSLLKKDSAKVDSNVWKNCQKVLNALDKVNSSKLLLSTATLKIVSGGKEASKRNLEKIEDMYSKLSDLLENIKESDAYKNRNEEKGTEIVFNASALNKEKSSIEETIKALETAQSKCTQTPIAGDGDVDNSITVIENKYQGVFFRTVALAIEKCNLQISVINTINSAAKI